MSVAYRSTCRPTVGQTIAVDMSTDISTDVSIDLLIDISTDISRSISRSSVDVDQHSSDVWVDIHRSRGAQNTQVRLAYLCTIQVAFLYSSIFEIKLMELNLRDGAY